MRISDWSSDVCSSDLDARRVDIAHEADRIGVDTVPRLVVAGARDVGDRDLEPLAVGQPAAGALAQVLGQIVHPVAVARFAARTEEHTSDLQSLMRSTSAAYRLKQKNKHIHIATEETP